MRFLSSSVCFLPGKIEDVGGFRHLERAILNADDVKPQ